MKKFFMKGTDDEVQFGDVIEYDFSEDKKGKTLHHHLECKFVPELVGLLLEHGVIEERGASEKHSDVKEEKASLDEVINEILDLQEYFNTRLLVLEEAVATMIAKLSVLFPESFGKKHAGK